MKFLNNCCWWLALILCGHVCLLPIYHYTFKAVEYMGVDKQCSVYLFKSQSWNHFPHHGCFIKHASINWLLMRKSFLETDDSDNLCLSFLWFQLQCFRWMIISPVWILCLEYTFWRWSHIYWNALNDTRNRLWKQPNMGSIPVSCWLESDGVFFCAKLLV